MKRNKKYADFFTYFIANDLSFSSFCRVDVLEFFKNSFVDNVEKLIYNYTK